MRYSNELMKQPSSTWEVFASEVPVTVFDEDFRRMAVCAEVAEGGYW